MRLLSSVFVPEQPRSPGPLPTQLGAGHARRDHGRSPAIL